MSVLPPKQQMPYAQLKRRFQTEDGWVWPKEAVVFEGEMFIFIRKDRETVTWYAPAGVASFATIGTFCPFRVEF